MLFKKNIVAPYSFSWRGREIKIDKINLMHTSKNGAALFYHFSVSSEGNFYRLRFDTNKMGWMLEAVEED
ncbi:hypothetical protein A2967_00210 [Candidatus Daviesbacteria bacterium RIFCSPLOWO2_01_FULL_41_32]|nr:MAG: hypothetical protein A2967_00210 [Candidatus Daviesbacteria bacterium RIFCSPLOWO2_01_FULL_41_32]